MKKSILITGVAGFIGSNLAQALLSQGHSIKGIDNLSSGTLENIPQGVTFHHKDILDPKIRPLFDNVDVVFHLAANSCLSDCTGDPLLACRNNIEGTVNVLEAVRQGGVRQLVFADTSAEYEGVTNFPSRIDCIKPESPYAVSKRSASLFCESYRVLYGLNIIIVRYFNVYGPAQDWQRVVPPVMAAFIMKLLRGQTPVIYGTGDKRRDFVYVDDVNAFHALLIGREDLDGRVYNVGSGHNFSIKEIYDLIEQKLGTGIVPEYKPDLVGEAQTTLADISVTTEELGWIPKVNIDEGLSQTIAYLEKCLKT